MPTNRPFFTNFLAAFRAHSALTASKTTTSPPSVTTTASTTSQFTLPSTSTAARNITTSTAPQPIYSPQQQRQHNHPTTSSPPNPSQLKSSTASPPTTSQTGFSPTATVPGAGPLSQRARHPSTSPPPRSPTQTPFTRVPHRRGSDSSSDGGFREVLGGEKWYIGGRTATGEERFYRMGMVRRERSWDRNSFDRLSL
ncbi:MAG: hypothetical protein Q9169_001354 [Polycauliona sp. 2 TL-2023]